MVMEGKLHIYHPKRRLNLFEYMPAPNNGTSKISTETPPNILLFIGGLFDNFQSPSYVCDLAKLFPRHEKQRYTVMQVQLSSAMKAWGVSNLDRDYDEISECIFFIKSTLLSNQTSNIVLMGHSTGCQDIFNYLYFSDPHQPARNERPYIQGAILQAPVSDREAILNTVNTKPASKVLYDKCIDLTSKTPQSDHKDIILPLSWTVSLFGPAPLSIARFLSLASPDSPAHPSQEDFFSSDLSDETLAKTFGSLGFNNILRSNSSNDMTTNISSSKPSLLILISGADEAVPKSIDKVKLLDRWRTALASRPQHPQPVHASSLVIPDAKHDVSGEDAASKYARLVKLRGAILRYLSETVEKISDDDVAWKIFNSDARPFEGSHKL